MVWLSSISNATTAKPTTVTVDVYRFNRDEVIAATIIKMCEEERDNLNTVLYDDETEHLASLEGLARAYLNKWDSPDPWTDGIAIWKQMCYHLSIIGPSMWD